MNAPLFYTKILGTGSAFPETRVTNYQISERVDTNHEWIVERTGIVERRISDTSKKERTCDLAEAAARLAIKESGLKPSDIGFILFATVSPDFGIPSSSTMLQHRLGIPTTCGALDINAACSGFVYGMSIADSFIRTGQANNILVVGAEELSKLVDWNDRNTCILFGDGAGAAVLSRSPDPDKSRLYSHHLYSDGSFAELFHLPPGGKMQMKGKEIFKVAVKMLADTVVEALEKNGLKATDLDWLIPHQANLRIIDAVARRLDFPRERVLTNVHQYGNTSAASTPTVLDEFVRAGKIKRGDLICFSVFGAGLTYGSTLLRY